jgi:hypothetical protein
MSIPSSLNDRAAAVKARNKVLESVPGSGFHDNDRDAYGKLAAPHMRHLPGGMGDGDRPLPRISAHAVAFMGKRDIIFNGPCAQQVLDALHRYHAKYSKLSPRDLTGTEIKMVDVISTYTIEDDRLLVYREDWNDVLHALDESGVGVSCVPMIPDGTTP